MLDDFDQEFWGRGTGSSGMPMTSGLREVKRAAERVLEQSTRLLEQRLKLKVNVAKSVIAPAATAVLLGYGFYFTSSGVRLRIAPRRGCGQRPESVLSRPGGGVCRWITGCGGSTSTCGAGWDISGWRTRPEVLRPGRMVSPSAATDPVEGMETAADAGGESACPRGSG